MALAFKSLERHWFWSLRLLKYFWKMNAPHLSWKVHNFIAWLLSSLGLSLKLRKRMLTKNALEIFSRFFPVLFKRLAKSCTSTVLEKLGRTKTDFLITSHTIHHWFHILSPKDLFLSDLRSIWSFMNQKDFCKYYSYSHCTLVRRKEKKPKVNFKCIFFKHPFP